MDQAPAALSNIFGSAFNEIREEVNELKQSKTSHVKKIEGLEAGQNEFRKLSEEVMAALVDFESRAETSEKQLKESSANIGQLERALYRAVLNAKSQEKTTTELMVSLAEAQNEIAALKLLLSAKNEVPSIEKEMEEGETPQQQEDLAADTAEMQPTEFFSFASSNSPPRSIREASIESSMTFCNAEQSMARRKRQGLGFADGAVPIPAALPGPMARPDGSVFIKNEDSKRRKMTVTRTHTTPRKGSPLKTFTLPVLPSQPDTSEKTQPIIPGSTEQSLDGETSHESLDALGDDTDMEDNITVAPKHARTAFALAERPLVPGSAGSPIISQFGTVADEVLRDLDVSSSTQSTSQSRPSNPAGATNVATQPTPLSPRAATSHVLPSDVARDDPDVTDPDTGFQHQPKNRGENDQTGVVGERSYQTVKLDNGKLYTVDRSRIHVHKVQPWKSWTVKKNGVWFQWVSYPTLDWTDRGAIAKMNNWREAALTRADFPKRLHGKGGSSLDPKLRTQAQLDSAVGAEEESFGGEASLAVQMSQTPKSITRTHLLSQFQARTGEMQRRSRSRSAKLSE